MINNGFSLAFQKWIQQESGSFKVLENLSLRLPNWFFYGK